MCQHLAKKGTVEGERDMSRNFTQYVYSFREVGLGGPPQEHFENLECKSSHLAPFFNVIKLINWLDFKNKKMTLSNKIGGGGLIE